VILQPQSYYKPNPIRACSSFRQHAFFSLARHVQLEPNPNSHASICRLRRPTLDRPVSPNEYGIGIHLLLPVPFAALAKKTGNNGRISFHAEAFSSRGLAVAGGGFLLR
jgi:hypothetical protein